MAGTEQDPQGTESRAPQSNNRYPVLAIVLAAVLMAVIDSTVVNIALPSMTGFFSANLSETQWTITAYLITMTSLLLVFGKISEFTGRARLFFAGIIIFTLSSLACGLSYGLPELILFRVLQGAGAAMLFSISSALIFASTPPDERGRSMGYLGSTVAIGSILGPVVGGFIVDGLGWQYIFFINIPIGAVLIIAALRYLRFDEPRKKTLTLDWHGCATMVTMFVSLIIALGSIAASAAVSLPAAAAVALFLLSLSLFVWHERRCREPLVDLSIFRTPAFLYPVVALVLVFIAQFMMVVTGPFYLEGVLGFRPSQVGMIFLISPAVMIIAAPIAGWLYDRKRTPYYATFGMLITAAAFFLLSFAALSREILFILVGFGLLGLGIGFFQTPNNTAIMSALPAQKLSSASSVSATSRNLGMSLGVSFGSILLAVQLSLGGYTGSILSAEPALLAGSVSGIMVLSGIISLFVAGLTLRGRSGKAIP